jgi:hypothetical protein
MTGDAFRFLATDQAADLGCGDARVVVEPVGRDTAPAILTAALMLEDTPDALMLVAPSDHVIGDAEAFRAGRAAKGAEAARTGAFVTFGVTPDRPETGYGYLRAGRHARERRAVPLKSFREKPDLRDRAGDAGGGRLPVERGHLPDAGLRSDRRPSRPTRPTWSAPAGRHRDGRRIWASSASAPRPTARPARFPSITRSWRRPSGSWPCRLTRAAGRIWAPGMRCGRRRVPMPAAMR